MVIIYLILNIFVIANEPTTDSSQATKTPPSTEQTTDQTTAKEVAQDNGKNTGQSSAPTTEPVAIKRSKKTILLLEKGTKIPLSGVNIFSLPEKSKFTTDPDGVIEFDFPENGSVQSDNQ